MNAIAVCAKQRRTPGIADKITDCPTLGSISVGLSVRHYKSYAFRFKKFIFINLRFQENRKFVI